MSCLGWILLAVILALLVYFGGVVLSVAMYLVIAIGAGIVVLFNWIVDLFRK